LDTIPAVNARINNKQLRLWFNLWHGKLMGKRPYQTGMDSGRTEHDGIATESTDAALIDYAHLIENELRTNMVRVDADFSVTPSEAKIAETERARVHTMLVIGPGGVEASAVSVRLHHGGPQGAQPKGRADASKNAGRIREKFQVRVSQAGASAKIVGGAQVAQASRLRVWAASRGLARPQGAGRFLNSQPGRLRYGPQQPVFDASALPKGEQFGITTQPRTAGSPLRWLRSPVRHLAVWLSPHRERVAQFRFDLSCRREVRAARTPGLDALPDPLSRHGAPAAAQGPRLAGHAAVVDPRWRGLDAVKVSSVRGEWSPALSGNRPPGVRSRRVCRWQLLPGSFCRAQAVFSHGEAHALSGGPAIAFPPRGIFGEMALGRA
jgi:hypothetical protein